MPRLVFTASDRVFEIVLEKTMVGRSPHNHLCIADPSLSREHCELYVYGPEVIVRDLGSRNGTFVNGRRISEEQCQIKHGQVVTFGGVEARLELESPGSAVFESSAAFERYQRVTQLAPSQAAAPAQAEVVSQEQTMFMLSPAAVPRLNEKAVPQAPVTASAQPKNTFLIILLLVLCLVLFYFAL